MGLRTGGARFFGCAKCGEAHPLTREWLQVLWDNNQLFCCRRCAAKLPPAELKKIHPGQPSRFTAFGGVGSGTRSIERLSRLASDAGVSLAWTLRRAAREFLKWQGRADRCA